MPEQKYSLPPHIGKWLASDKPALREKAEAALHAAEQDANDFLFEQIEKEQKNAVIMYVLTLCLAQMPFQFATRHGNSLTISRICLGILLAAPFFYVGLRFLLSPAGSRFNAVILALARRGDLRAVPWIVQVWQPRFKNKSAFETDKVLLALLQKAVPGTVSFSREHNAKDKFSFLRARFNSLLVKRKGEYTFHPAAVATPDKVRIWLALLAHLNADPNAKSRVLLERVAEAHPLTLDEEVVRNTARALLDGIPVETIGEPASVSTPTPEPLEMWKPTETNDAPTLLQRLGRR